MYAGVNAEKYKQSAEAIYSCVNDLRKKNISEEEFLRGKEQLISSQIFAQESTSSQMLLFGKELLYRGRVYNFEDRVNPHTPQECPFRNRLKYKNTLYTQALTPLSRSACRRGGQAVSVMGEIKYGFEPVYDNNSRLLILGSFPSVKSRQIDFYFATAFLYLPF